MFKRGLVSISIVMVSAAAYAFENNSIDLTTKEFNFKVSMFEGLSKPTHSLTAGGCEVGFEDSELLSFQDEISSLKTPNHLIDSVEAKSFINAPQVLRTNCIGYSGTDFYQEIAAQSERPNQSTSAKIFLPPTL